MKTKPTQKENARNEKDNANNEKGQCENRRREMRKMKKGKCETDNRN